MGLRVAKPMVHGRLNNNAYTSSGWQDVLKEIKGKNVGSTIETKY